MAPKIVLVDPDLGPLTDDLLTPDVRVYQRAKGHRFSSDDVATAYFAWRARPDARRVIDLGCGLGSVLLLLAWKMQGATLVGVEAQETSFSLLTRNVARNALDGRVAIVHGDLRDAATLASASNGEKVIASAGSPSLPPDSPWFDLVTGTPPYFPEETAVDAVDAQRALARIEYRGGVEAYIAAGSKLMAEDGAMVLCGDARSEARVERACEASGLALRAAHVVVPRAGRPPLFSVWELVRSEGAAREVARSTMTLRDEQARSTRDADALRVFSGFASLFD
jgi:tRNA1Val (adenine37-N6)-methyltransferase